jgi:hypothetical protein
MKLTVLLGAASFFLVNVASGHVFDKRLVELFLINSVGFFTVSDTGDCAASITAVMEDPTIASVDPANVTAVRQTFGILALKGGTTNVVVTWQGVGNGCDDVGSATVLVIVHSGPDLVLVRPDVHVSYYSGLQGGEAGKRSVTARAGSDIGVGFYFRNIGDDSTRGTYRFRLPLGPAFRYLEGSEGCESNGQTATCSSTTPLPRFEEKSTGYVFFELVEFGRYNLRPFVDGGSDVRLTNNDGDVIAIDSRFPRYADPTVELRLKRTRGRRR